MPASIPVFQLHCLGDVYRFGLHAEPAHMFLHEVTDSARRTRSRIMDENQGVSLYEYFMDAGMTYSVDCHVRAQQGIQNQHPGSSVSGSVLQILVGQAPFRFDLNTGEFVFMDPTRRRAAGQFHQVQFDIEHLFPEGATFGATLGLDVDNPSSTPIDVGGAVEGEGGLDPETGGEALRTLKLHYHFFPARGHATATFREGTVTRLMSRNTNPNLSQIYAYGNPPALEWQSMESGSSEIPGSCAWDATDHTGTLASETMPGRYLLVGVWCLETNSWIYQNFDELGSYTNQDTVAHGTDIIVIRFTNGTKRLLTGDFPTLAAVRTFLSLADNTTFTAVYAARSNTYLHGTAIEGLDELAFWRISRAQPVGPRYFQFFELFGTRTPVGTFHYLRCTYNNYFTDYIKDTAPNPPPATRQSLITAQSAYLLDAYAAVFCCSDGEYDDGDATAVTSLGIAAPADGEDLWIFQYGTYGSSSGKWDHRRGTLASISAFWSAQGHSGSFSETDARYRVIFHANGNNGTGKYYKGSTADGQVWDTVGLSLY